MGLRFAVASILLFNDCKAILDEDEADRAFEPGLGAETTVFAVVCTSTSRWIAVTARGQRGDSASAQLRRTGTASFKLAGSSQVRAMEACVCA